MHSLGIVHRDLKPSNVFLTKRRDGSPLVKLIDFGIAKALEHTVLKTEFDTILGSPRYMAPEQLLSAATVDTRADIWSLGTLVYDLSRGSPRSMGARSPSSSRT